MVNHDAGSNTTKAVTKRTAIDSVVLAAAPLFASLIEMIGTELQIAKTDSGLFHELSTQINVADPKKLIQEGPPGGKGFGTPKEPLIGQLTGYPFKDNAGPAMHPLIKVINLVSLLILPAVISLRHNDTARYAIAGVALVVLAVAIAYSKRKVSSMTEDEDAVEAMVPDDGIGPDDPPERIALEALDRWIYDLGDEEHELRQQLRKAKIGLEAELKASLASATASPA